MPLWYGCEVPGAEKGAIVLRDGLQQRWVSPQYAALLSRLRPAITIPVEEIEDAEARIDQRTMTFQPAIENANELLANAVDAAIQHGHLGLTLGGDHALGIGSIAGASRNATKLGVIWIDTHPDLNTPEGSMSGHIHGMPLGAAIGRTTESMPRSSTLAGSAPMLEPENLCLLGIRDIDVEEEQVILEKGIFARTMDEWNDIGIIPGLKAAIAHLEKQGVDAVHLSFDLDVLDPAYLPGTGTRYPGGLTVREASQVLRYLGNWDAPIRSMDMVELNPVLDPSGHSTDIALHLLATALGQRMLGRG
jgi:arginase